MQTLSLIVKLTSALWALVGAALGAPWRRRRALRLALRHVRAEHRDAPPGPHTRHLLPRLRAASGDGPRVLVSAPQADASVTLRGLAAALVAERRIPIVIGAEHLDGLHPFDGLAAAVQDTLGAHRADGVVEALHDAADSGRVVLLIEGLDRASPAGIERVVRWARHVPAMPIVVTCAPPVRPLSGFTPVVAPPRPTPLDATPG